MHCGLDFGTTNSALAYFNEQQLTFAELNAGCSSIPTAAWLHRKDGKIADITEREISEIYDQRFRAATTGRQGTLQKRRDDIRNQLTAERMRDLKLEVDEVGISSADFNQQIYVGHEALEMHSSDHQGVLVKSPKAALGGLLNPELSNHFETIIGTMIGAYKTNAEANIGQDLNSVVIGRPVNWGIKPNPTVNQRALDLMRNAAEDAGFKHVEFQYEPVAAAYDYEQSLSKQQTTLVVDVGGGTTDVVMMRLGGNQSGNMSNEYDRSSDILAAHGTRVGGMDLDISLALNRLGRLFGKEYRVAQGNTVTSIVHDYQSAMMDAFRINDLPAIRRFLSHKDRLVTNLGSASGERYDALMRLFNLYQNSGNTSVVMAAEKAKIALSANQETRAELEFIEMELAMDLNRQDLVEAIHYPAMAIKRAIKEVLTSANTQPQSLIITGGGASSPALFNLLGLDEYRDILAPTDMLLGVGKGLAISSEQMFA